MQWEQVRLQTKAKITIMWPEYRCVTMHNTKTQLSTIHHLTPEQSFLSFQIRVHPTHWTETAMKTQEKYWQLFLNAHRMFTHGKHTLKLDKSYQLVGCSAGKWFPPEGRDSSLRDSVRNPDSSVSFLKRQQWHINNSIEMTSKVFGLLLVNAHIYQVQTEGDISSLLHSKRLFVNHWIFLRLNMKTLLLLDFEIHASLTHYKSPTCLFLRWWFIKCLSRLLRMQRLPAPQYTEWREWSSRGV